MRTRIRSLAILVLASCPFTAASANDLKLPWTSPAASVSQTIGVTEITVHYHRPALKGRDLEQDLAALASSKQVWRLGANDATRLIVTDPINLGGEDVPAGEYGFYAIPDAEEWTFIVSRQSKNWGSYGYDPKQDVARIYVKPEKIPESVEWLSFAFDPVAPTQARLRLEWATMRLSIPIEVDVDAIVARRIETELSTIEANDWDTRLAIAKYWCERDENLERADELTEQALGIQRHFWTCEWRAKVLAKRGRKEEAIPLLEEAIRLAEGRAPKEYVANLHRVVTDWKH